MLQQQHEVRNQRAWGAAPERGDRGKAAPAAMEGRAAVVQRRKERGGRAAVAREEGERGHAVACCF